MNNHFKILSVILVALVAESTFGQVTSAQRTALEKVKTDSLTNADYQQTLQRFGIKLPLLPSLAEDPNCPKTITPKGTGGGYTDVQGRPYTRSLWGTWTNYEEGKANNFILPNPLVLKNGKPVTSSKIWWEKRRPEIVNDYENEVFGRIPQNTPKVTFEVNDIDKSALEGTAIKKTITGHIDYAAYPAANPIIKMVLYLPAKANGPVPLMVVASPNTTGDVETIKLLIRTGWAIAIFATNSLQADNGAGLSQGIIGLVGRGKPRNPGDWGSLRAWSWGLSRALDYFQTDKAINAKQIGIEGHSRWGKTVLLAAAMDSRWAIVFSSCSGSGGASLEKRNYGETIDLIAGPNEYHWMAPNFVKYAGNWEALPVDAHDMIALIAPRPLFITGGTGDLWADPFGELKACVAATPVYTLLGKTGISVNNLPAPDVSLISGDLAFRNHEGGHVDTLDWPVFIEFAKKYFK